MFGIGKLSEQIRRLERIAGRHTQIVEGQVECDEKIVQALAELRAAICLFARKCDQCKQWKPKDAKGWHKREGGSGLHLGYATGGFPTVVSALEKYICPDCMAALKPAGEA